MEEMQWEYWCEGEQTPDAHFSLHAGLARLGRYFVACDGHISESEAAFLVDIEAHLIGSDYDMLDNRYFKEEIEMEIAEHPED